MNYSRAFDAAEKAVRISRCIGKNMYREGVERAAALAAVDADAKGACIVDAMAKAIEAYRANTNPAWDGSIG